MHEQATSWSSCPSRAEEGGFDGAVEAAGASTSNQQEVQLLNTYGILWILVGLLVNKEFHGEWWPYKSHYQTGFSTKGTFFTRI
jgi:hypothetical protein